MSRSGYLDDCDGWDLIRWRGAVASATKGKRGQAFLTELLASLDALPKKELIAGVLECDGAVCALGAVARARGQTIPVFPNEDYEQIAHHFGIADALAREIMYMNDEGTFFTESAAQRWARMRKWVREQLVESRDGLHARQRGVPNLS